MLETRLRGGKVIKTQLWWKRESKNKAYVYDKNRFICTVLERGWGWGVGPHMWPR